MYNRLIPYLILFSALSVSISAAFYSVFGLAKLFSGAETQVIIMASTLEASKIIIASALYRKWKIFSTLIKVYLSSALIILIIITSAGVYGYLSAAYQVTKSKDLLLEKQISLIEQVKKTYSDRKTEYDNEKQGLITSIEQLRSSLGNNYLQSVDKKTGQLIRTTSAASRRSYEIQLDEAIKRRDYLSNKSNEMIDSISSNEIKIINIRNASEVSSELGPLKYISTLTNKSMDVIVNWFLLLLIFVFDPLAIILMITSSILFIQPKNESVKLNTPIEENSVADTLSDEFYNFLKSNQDKNKKASLTADQIRLMSHQDVKKYLEENLD